MDKAKVFCSEISRVDCEKENHLYDLLKIEPAKPISQRPPCTKNEDWEFKPNFEKHYLPKRLQSKLKVNTVSDVRALFEKDVYTYLTSDIELQQNYFMRKIRDGSSNEEKTIKTVIALLNTDKPISRSSWQMINNINPEKHNHSKQFVLWNGKCVQVNGSKGGKYKFICNHDLKVKTSLKNVSKFKKSGLKSRIGLLRNSLSVKFKPGPLGKKKFLDVSHHKYRMGNIELVQLPTPLLEVSPAYGTILEPAISSFVNNLRDEKGVIPRKLAEFAVSVLGTTRNNTAMQLDENCCITFDLNYKCQQNRIMMRRNVVDTTSNINNENNKTKLTRTSYDDENNTNSNVKSRIPLERDTVLGNDESIFEIKQIMEEMLDSVCISLNQDNMYSKEDEPRGTILDDGKVSVASKDKFKRKYCELDKLDVTIINLPESSNKDYTKPCEKSFCTMGCVCESLDSVLSLKQHCGNLDCMFGCKCEVSKYKTIELSEDCCDIIPGILNLDNEINSHMAKEEQKFHQTVIFSGEKSILLKSRKRNWKSSTRYAEFYSKMNLKGDEKIKKILTIDIERLNCENIVPFCMVHNLYKCFCKGKFIETYIRNDSVTSPNNTLNNENVKVQHEAKSIESTKCDPESSVRNVLRPRIRKTYGNCKLADIPKYSSNNDDDYELGVACARTVGYHGRKHSDEYYFSTNSKIMEMERNDILLRNKMLKLINGKSAPSETNSESLDCETVGNEIGEVDGNTKTIHVVTEDSNKNIANKTANRKRQFFDSAKGKSNLKIWLETSYKYYKERVGKGIVNNCLGAPKKGKAALQSWDFILSRYRERKNIFVVSKQEPFRTFLVVDHEHPIFANCINIDDIRFADLPKYPIIVRNLVTNAIDSENYFCILRGWDHCWELIGSVVKVIEGSGSPADDGDFIDTDNLMTKYYSSDGDDECVDQTPDCVPWQDGKECNKIDQDTSSEKSKWFVLTIEDDFTEIQFYKKGFYVTREGIQRSINLARISGKTVRLSSRARTDKTQNNTHPYGIYAIPCTIQSCVFIGPYEENEPLGIEVVKLASNTKRMKKTRGVWIHTNKVDNMNVIDNPLAYLPLSTVKRLTIRTANSDMTADPKLTTENDEKSQKEKEPQKEISITKQVKPIKIRRTNGFYHLSPKNILQKIARPDLLNTKSSILKEPFMTITPQKNVASEPRASTSSMPCIRPVAEITPQIKITNVYSESKLQNSSNMLILKPEEINKKVALVRPAINHDLHTDIEKFLETSKICTAPNEEVLVISDGEDDAAASSEDVWIQCTNVVNFGYIRAKINDTGISFEFPGFKYSEFYEESEAFDKINQVLARKMYIPAYVKLKWEVVREKQCLTCDMLTPKCLKDNKYLLYKLRERQAKKQCVLKVSPVKSNTTEDSSTEHQSSSAENVITYVVNKKTPSTLGVVSGADVTRNKQMEFIQGLEEASRKLEHQSAVLWNEGLTRLRDEIFGSLSVPDNRKEDMQETLNDIMSMNRQ